MRVIDDINFIDTSILEACNIVVFYQKELIELLAETLQVNENEVFYTWAFRQCKQRGFLQNTKWQYFFHGFECDLTNADGRCLRMDFGPEGIVDTFTAWGILKFITNSKKPWFEFPNLSKFFNEKDVFDDSMIDITRMSMILENLEEKKFIEMASKELVDLLNQYTTIDESGICYVKFPTGVSEKKMLDCSVANRYKISKKGHEFLLNKNHLQNITI